MTKNNPNQTDANQVRKQNQASQQQNQNAMTEEFGSETDVNQVRRQNQQSQQNMRNQNNNQTR